ncbi:MULTISPECIES: AAA family ATPase [Pseudomonas]|uniref:ATP-dependent Zn protease n=1 Tax=Pseudomonas oryzihabitans TaxID=47885 RepID=A0A178LAU8_9PSED|nr:MULTISPECIES: AAA family ATPase [Pseudomonas]KXJ32262.1 ATP-dependent Zn protease [Pseudomonas sp. HUK17]MDC7831768.1 AAA family ATPase [Pseudomonas benzopyrenica]MXS20167.1 AAA family ATPase [Pseudomonas oryzihabitans]NRH42024.1 AAA family ATPase [Pseudomonas sp. MS15a(2019)]OAN26962.1 ATP-dependent Zn protease [Pseudomonas oryzihabitans]
MKKSVVSKYPRLLIAGVLALVTLVSLACWWWLKPSTPAPTATAMLASVQQAPEHWTQEPRDFSVLLADLRAGVISGAVIGDRTLYVDTTRGEHYAVTDNGGRLTDRLLADYATQAEPLFPIATWSESGQRHPWLDALLFNLPGYLLLLLLAVPLALRFASPFKLHRKGTGISFKDVVGAAEAKRALEDVTTCLRNPKAFAALGARPPKGVLLTGEPGTGKTQLAKALATECNAHFIQVTGSDFSSMFFGVGIQKVKSLFRTARKKAPCIIFIDEIDGIGRRAEQSRSSDAEANRIINQFLTELDGFDGTSGVLVLGATNFADSLDPALRREGRFDRTIAVPLPSLEDRRALFELYAGKLPCQGELDLAALSRGTVGLTPAAIAYISNHAALLAARENASAVTMAHFVEAIETCRIGEQPVGVTPLGSAERTRIAVHEAGHALVAAVLNVGRVEKVTLLPRGQALGVTLITPTEDKRLHLKSELEGRIQMLLAGRCAEQLYFNEVSSGAAQDLQEASKLALSMVASLGMGPSGSLLSLQALRDAGIDFDAAPSIAAADQLLHSLDHRCLALITELKPALDDITDQLLRDETIPGSAVAEAIARASGLEACGALNRALAFVPERSTDPRAGDGERSIAAAFKGE